MFVVLVVGVLVGFGAVWIMCKVQPSATLRSVMVSFAFLRTFPRKMSLSSEALRFESFSSSYLSCSTVAVAEMVTL